MAADWERCLDRWTKAGLIAASTADRIRGYETDRDKARGFRWPIAIAVAFGGLLLAAGILLFVAAHWDVLSPAQRFTLILFLVASMHVAGALATARFGILATALHAVGTVSLGAGIFLAGQIFHLQEHWPGGVMLWALGAWAAWALLRDWPQVALAAVLTPAWLAGEWIEAAAGWIGADRVLTAGLSMLAFSYLTALSPGKDSAVRRALAWIGGISLIPAAAAVAFFGLVGTWHRLPMPESCRYLGWAGAFGIPLALAGWLRGRAAWMNAVTALWVAALSAASARPRPGYAWATTWGNEFAVYALCALGSVGLIAWGMKEGRKERVNLGIAGFALTVLFFYFSTVMDKLERSASLTGLGLLFLLGGWTLEKARRRLLAQMTKGAA